VAPKQKPGRSKQDYATPTEFLKAVQKLLKIDSFSIDLAADSSNACAAKYYTVEDDSLAQDWTTIEGWAWLNPPYGHIEPWVRKVWESEASIAVLVPASVGSNWWKRWVHDQCTPIFLNGRLAFMRDRPKWLYPKDCALLLYSTEANESSEARLYRIWNWRSDEWT
jgi:phage N-6-adenine-methyltransferase